MQNGIARGGLSEEERNNCHIFCWYNESGYTVELDLLTGIFNINGQILHTAWSLNDYDVACLSNSHNIEYRLIYGKRHFIGQGSAGSYDVEGPYLLGYQFTREVIEKDKKIPKNYQRILYLLPNNEVMLAGKN